MVVALPQSSSWTVTFADLMANFLCLMLLNLALSHTATEKVAPALRNFAPASMRRRPPPQRWR
ncbi:hypothetical protein E6W36_14595 [Hankyongella ginsenosidimutans]|uniref:Uncharacterized protein n=1 Tax=Hankyongella ginsenosidimutans TaxID=1763828 RepID=A0A4D7C807_9SPHN|nr:flagellar motor protein MotB [Hankyongella ginsenosidimutans]QCI80295.1 hypothetical protein E6W36_14595 [Hankyongella ginsenosidimutans]